MRISKSDAHEVALKMTSKHQKELEDAKKALIALAINITKTHTPAAVLEFYSKYPSYIQASHRINVFGEGLQHTEIRLGDYRAPSKDGYYPTFQLTRSEATQVRKAMELEEKLEADIEKLQVDIKNAIIGLGSYNKITESFPEAAVFLPVKMRTEVAINLKEIRKALK